MAAGPIGALHVLAAGAALASGTAVAIAAKGAARHRLLGRVYLAAMVGANLTALSIYGLTGRANLFHLFALISLASLAAGWATVRRRRPGWRAAHARSMLWSYVGLLAAAVSELLVRVPGVVSGWTSFGVAVAVGTGGTFLVGAVLIHRTVARLR